MNRILVIGATGYIGSRISKHLSMLGYEVSIFVRKIPEKKNWNFIKGSVITGDVAKRESIHQLRKYNFDIAINLVSLDSNDSNKDPNYVASINLMPTWNILEILAERGLKKFIYFSTIHVYGELQRKKIDEDTDLKTTSVYGLTHLLTEKICDYYNQTSDIDCVNLRLSNSYGSPAQKDVNCWWLVLNDFSKSAYLNGKIVIKSDGSPQRDFIHWSDIMHALELVIKHKKYSVYNLASGETFTIVELAKIVKEEYYRRYNKFLDIVILKEKNHTTELNRYNFSTKRLKDIGFIKKTSVNDGINELFSYMEKSF